MVTAEGERGNLHFEHDFAGAEIPVEGTGGYAGTGTAGYKIGPFKVTGDHAQSDRGAISVAVSNGALRLGGGNQDGKGVAVGTEVILSPALNGPMVLTTRVQRAAVTAGVVFAGFCNVNADDVAEPVANNNGTSYTLTATDLAGFSLDSLLTATADWHCVFNGGTVTGVTDSTQIVTGTSNARNVNSVAVQTAVAGEYDLLKLEAYTNGTVKWWINNILVQQQANAISTTVLQAGYVGIWGTTTTVVSLDVDYLDIKAKRNWAR